MTATITTGRIVQSTTNVARRYILDPTDKIKIATRMTMMKLLSITRIKYVKI